MSNPLDEVTFWSIVDGLGKRTIVCSPEMESRVKGWISARGLVGTLTVVVNRCVRDDQVLVLDTDGAQAELNRSMIRASTELSRAAAELRRRSATVWPSRYYYLDLLPPSPPPFRPGSPL